MALTLTVWRVCVSILLMSNIRDKQKVLSLLHSKSNDFVERMFDKGGCEYADLVTFNAHNSGSISMTELESILGTAYKSWHSRIIKAKPKTDIQRALQATLAEESQYQPNHIALGDGFYHFFSERFGREFPMSDSPVTLVGSIDDGFFHIMGNQHTSIECRLYLNLMSKNVADFATLFISECEKKGLPYYFKFCLHDYRNDHLPIYTNYENALDIIKVIKHIEKSHPYIFVNADKMNPMLAKIGNYIGFGEEPTFDRVSFNRARADAVNHFVTTSKQTLVKELFTKPMLKSPRFATDVDLDDYIINYITTELDPIAKKHNIDIHSTHNQSTIRDLLPAIYDYIIAGDKDEYHISLQTIANEQRLISAKFSLTDKLMSVFRISNRLSNNARLTALLENIYTSQLSKHIVTTSQGVSLPFDKFIVDIFRERALDELQNIVNSMSSADSYNAKIAQHEIKCNTELGRLAIMRAVATYIQRCGSFADPYVELNLSPVSMEKFALGCGFTDTILTHNPQYREQLLTLSQDALTKERAFAKYDVSANYPFLNASTLREISTVSKLIR